MRAKMSNTSDLSASLATVGNFAGRRGEQNRAGTEERHGAASGTDGWIHRNLGPSVAVPVAVAVVVIIIMRAKSWKPTKPSPSASTPPIMRRQSSRLHPSASPPPPPRMATMTPRSSSASMRPSPSASNTRNASISSSSAPDPSSAAAMAATASRSSSERSPWPSRRSTASSSRREISAGRSTDLGLGIISSYLQARSHGPMSHTRLLYLQAQQNHAKFQDNHTSILKKEAAVGTTQSQPRQKQVKFQDNHANVIKKDDVNKDVDTVASDFIKRRHMSWGLQKSTTMYPAS